MSMSPFGEPGFTRLRTRGIASRPTVPKRNPGAYWNRARSCRLPAFLYEVARGDFTRAVHALCTHRPRRFLKVHSMSFETLGLDPKILQALTDSGYTAPTPVQTAAVPLVLA